jgi:hypothetical protein
MYGPRLRRPRGLPPLCIERSQPVHPEMRIYSKAGRMQEQKFAKNRDNTE